MVASNPLISLDNVSRSYQSEGAEVTALKQVSLTIQKGEFVAIMGQSGSGKSTLLGLLAGLDVPSSGSIDLMGKALQQLTEDERAQVRADHVGFVFQSFQLMPNLTALENVMLPLEITNQASVQERAHDILSKVGLSHRLDHYPNQLSGGEQQRVALARAFVTEPDILFADEPTGNLDTHTGKAIAQQLFDLNESRHTTLVLVTHDLTLAEQCQRTLVMNAGILKEQSR